MVRSDVMIPIQTIPVGPFQANCYVVACPITGEAAVVDPGDASEVDRILDGIESLAQTLGRSLQVRSLLHTHAHLDHFGGTRALREELERTGSKPEIALHRGDEELWKGLREQGSAFGFEYDEPLPVDRWLVDGESWKLGSLTVEVIHTPGHSPGGVCFRVGGEWLFTGDTLFQGSIGRTDLWGGDGETLLGSIQSKLLVLPERTAVFSGHGFPTTIGAEKNDNPYLMRQGAPW